MIKKTDRNQALCKNIIIRVGWAVGFRKIVHPCQSDIWVQQIRLTKLIPGQLVCKNHLPSKMSYWKNISYQTFANSNSGEKKHVWPLTAYFGLLPQYRLAAKKTLPAISLGKVISIFSHHNLIIFVVVIGFFCCAKLIVTKCYSMLLLEIKRLPGILIFSTCPRRPGLIFCQTLDIQFIIVYHQVLETKEIKTKIILES